MLEIIGSTLMSFLEQELVKHEPEIQEMIIDQLSKLSELIVNFLSEKKTE